MNIFVHQQVFCVCSMCVCVCVCVFVYERAVMCTSETNGESLEAKLRFTHECDRTKQGLKGPAAGWRREKKGGGREAWELYCPGGGLGGWDRRQQGSSSPPGS